MNINIETISPDRARDLLSRNKSNRPISKGVVRSYARDMAANNWTLTHQGICIGKDGSLLDGQHRLSAIVMADISLEMAVAYDDTFDNPMGLPVDIGRKRIASDIYRISVSLSSVASFAARNIYGIEAATPAEKIIIAEKLAPFHDLLSKGTRKGISTAAVRLAACAHIMSGTSDEYVYDIYDQLVNDFSKLPPYASSFFKQVVVDRVRFDQNQMLSRAIRVFDPSRKMLSRLQVNDEQVAYAEAQSFVSNAFTKADKGNAQ